MYMCHLRVRGRSLVLGKRVGENIHMCWGWGWGWDNSYGGESDLVLLGMYVG